MPDDLLRAAGEQPVSVMLTGTLRARLESSAERDQRSRSAQMRVLLREALDYREARETRAREET